VTPHDVRRSFPPTARLVRPADFSRVYRQRQSAAAGPLVLYAAANGLPDGRVRLGLSVGRRVGNAVVRNRWKRSLREAFRAIRPGMPAGTDIVLVVRGGPPPRGAEAARDTAATLAALAGRVTGRSGYRSARPQPDSPASARPPQADQGHGRGC
jgi:ribonuclease P protein component